MQLPPRQDGQAAWTSAELLADTDSWSYELPAHAIAELEQAAEAVVGVDAGSLRRGDVLLPMLSRRLDAVRAGLLHGRGVVLLRGMAVDRYSTEEAAAIFTVLGVHLGSLRPQNRSGDLLGTVRDVGADFDDPNTRIYQTNARQTFHTDSTDVVALLCLQKSKSGGESMLVSAGAIYNAMLVRRPDLLRRLFDPVATDRRGEVPAGDRPWFEIPVLSWFAHRLTVIYQRQYIDSASRFEDATQPDAEQVEALDLFDEIANDPEYHATMDFERGDMQFVHNHSLLHDRMGFEDWPEPDRRRHLLRLWLSVPGDRELPPVFAQRYGSVEVGNRGGIVTA
jgi:alpha-ketoglutarate-dependent taurine dioxygenase